MGAVLSSLLFIMARQIHHTLSQMATFKMSQTLSRHALVISPLL